MGKLLRSIGLLALLAGICYIVVIYRFDVVDAVLASRFQAMPEINKIKSNINLTPKGERIFLASRPESDDKSKFAENCPVTEKSLVLGCYSEGEIFVLRVDEPRLSGVMDVTAAHEMLHAAYERLLPWDRHRVDELVRAEYQRIDNQRIKDLVATYESTGSANIPNELHSIIGTEVRNVSPELESYYSQYFTDRKKIVGFSEKYESVFVELEQKVEMLDQQIEKFKSQIDILQTNLEAERSALDSTRSRMNSLLSSGRTADYNSLVPEFNQGVRLYNSKIAELDKLVKDHNDVVNQRNAAVLDQRSLTQSLDSTYQEIE